MNEQKSNALIVDEERDYIFKQQVKEQLLGKITVKAVINK